MGTIYGAEWETSNLNESVSWVACRLRNNFHFSLYFHKEEGCTTGLVHNKSRDTNIPNMSKALSEVITVANLSPLPRPKEPQNVWKFNY